MKIPAEGAVVEGRWLAGDVEVEGERIVRVGLPSTGRSLVLPGLIDLHVCGYAGADFNVMDAEDLARARARLARDGVVAFQPTVITDDADIMVRQVELLATAANGPGLTRIVGIHAEGPFLSPSHSGVHRKDALRAPDRSLVERLVAAGPIRTITIAPELDGAIDLIGWCAQHGITVQLGHTGADAATAHAAFDAGARGVTHVFNGMAAFAHRMPNVAAVALARPDVHVQVIADDVHLAREVALTALYAAEGRSMLVTDSTSAAGGAEGPVTIAGLNVTVTDGVPRLADGTLAGSTVTLREQVTRLIAAGWAPDRAANLATLAPARYAGLPHAGVLRVGNRANVLVLDADLELERVLLDGKKVSA